jgi:hypothetical protein
MDIADRVRWGFEIFNRRDWDAVARGLPEDFEAIDHVAVDERHAHGPYALREITNSAGDSALADLRMEATEVEVVSREGGEVQAVTRVAASASGGRSGAPVSGEIGQLWTFVGGVPKRFEQFRSWEEARRAAGLE